MAMDGLGLAVKGHAPYRRTGRATAPRRFRQSRGMIIGVRLWY
jgi:hypothetical protein